MCSSIHKSNNRTSTQYRHRLRILWYIASYVINAQLTRPPWNLLLNNNVNKYLNSLHIHFELETVLSFWHSFFLLLFELDWILQRSNVYKQNQNHQLVDNNNLAVFISSQKACSNSSFSEMRQYPVIWLLCIYTYVDDMDDMFTLLVIWFRCKCIKKCIQHKLYA